MQRMHTNWYERTRFSRTSSGVSERSLNQVGPEVSSGPADSELCNDLTHAAQALRPAFGPQLHARISHDVEDVKEEDGHAQQIGKHRHNADHKRRLLKLNSLEK